MQPSQVERLLDILERLSRSVDTFAQAASIRAGVARAQLEREEAQSGKEAQG